MSTDSLSQPFARSLNLLARKRASDQYQLDGKALPCSVVAIKGNAVQVKFELTTDYTLPNVVVPQAMSRYFRPPTAVGDRGVVLPADAMVWPIAGLSTGVANQALEPGNLSALVFQPVSQASWPSTPAGVAVVTAPNGVIITDDAGDTLITIGTGGTITITASKLVVTTLPTSAGSAGQLWNSVGTVKVS